MERRPLRVTDRDRDRAAAALRRGAVSGAIGIDTFEVRVGAAYSARTRDQLRQLTSDLPTLWARVLTTVERVVATVAPAPRGVLAPPPGARSDDVLLIGRSGACELVFSESSVSRRHAVLRQTAEGDWVLLDAGSLNGTRVNGRHVARCVLRDGDRVGLGALELRWRAPVVGG